MSVHSFTTKKGKVCSPYRQGPFNKMSLKLPEALSSQVLAAKLLFALCLLFSLCLKNLAGLYSFKGRLLRYFWKKCFHLSSVSYYVSCQKLLHLLLCYHAMFEERIKLECFYHKMVTYSFVVQSKNKTSQGRAVIFTDNFLHSKVSY